MSTVKNHILNLRMNEVYVILSCLKLHGRDNINYIRKYARRYEEIKEKNPDRSKKFYIKLDSKEELVFLINILPINLKYYLDSECKNITYKDGNVLCCRECSGRNTEIGCYYVISKYLYNYLTKISDKWFDTKFTEEPWL